MLLDIFLANFIPLSTEPNLNCYVIINVIIIIKNNLYNCWHNPGSAITKGREKLEVVWAEFSTVSLAVLLIAPNMWQQANGHF